MAAVAVQPIEALAAPVAIWQVVLNKDIAEAQPSSQVEDIKEEELGAVFKAHGEITEDKADKVDKTELLKLSAKEIIRMGLPAVPTIWEPIAAIPKLDLKVINLLNKLLFAAWCASKPINGFSMGVKSNNLPN